MMEYVDFFFDKADVVKDLSNYIKLLSLPGDAQMIKTRLNDRIKNAIDQDPTVRKQPKNTNNPDHQIHFLASLKVLRYSFVYHKFMRMLGCYDKLDIGERMDLVNKIYSTFLQAMEFHPSASSHMGVGVNHLKQPHNVQPRDELNSLDKINAEDLVMIAVELLHETELYDATVFNPINFIMLSILEHASGYFPQSIRIKQWMTKVYAKLGLVTIVQQLANDIEEILLKPKDTKDDYAEEPSSPFVPKMSDLDELNY